jgi:renalase
MRIAIVGAGMAGLACAAALVERGHSPVLFDKGRGPGGRMSTRRVDAAGETLRFDHGAQYFTVRDPGFAAQVARWERDGVAARWPLAGEDTWVGTPGMNAPVRAMAGGHAVAWNTRVAALTREGKHWQLCGAGSGESFDAVVVAVPAEQAAPLLAPIRADLAERAANTRSAPCWTAMVAFAEPVATARTSSATRARSAGRRVTG